MKQGEVGTGSEGIVIDEGRAEGVKEVWDRVVRD